MVNLNVYLIFLLIALIGLAILLAVRIFRDRENKRVKDTEDNISSDGTDDRFILFFKQFSETEIDAFYNFLAPDKEIIKETETFLGEGKLGSKIFPAEIGSSITQTIERQIKAPTPLFKYEYVVKKLRQDNKLTIIDSGAMDGSDLMRFESLMNELKVFNIELSPEVVETTRANIKNRKTIDNLLKERILRYTKLNCLILNFPFKVKKDEQGYKLISERDSLHETTVSVELSNETLTPRGREYFQTADGQRRFFSIFGEAEISEAKEGEFILITSFVVF